MGRMIGIDLGTTNSVMATFDKGSIKILHNKEGNQQTRSIVGYWRDDLLVGDPASRLLTIAPKDTVVSIKRLMGRAISDPEVEKLRKLASYNIVEPSDGTEDSVCVVLGNKEYYPEDISAMILKKLKDDAEFLLGEEVTHAVITVPAYFNEKQKQATWEAGVKAGLVVMDILDEPTAAAIAYGTQDENESVGADKALLVYDLGGGTFDVSILMMATGTFLPFNLEGDMWLGGDNFDQKIVDYAVEKIKKEYNVDPISNIKFMAALKEESKKAKEALSAARKVDLLIPGTIKDDYGDPIPFEIEITREQFEKMIEPLVDKTIDLVDKAKKGANISVDFILMAGNASSVPLVQEKMETKYGKDKILRNIHLKNCVAMGAAVMAAKGLITCPKCKCQNRKQDTECKKCGETLVGETGGNETGGGVFKIAPFSYGVQTSDDKFSIFINKNDSVPTPIHKRLTQTFYTCIPNQRRISIPVYGGDNFECASKNEKQGDITAFMSPIYPAGTAVHVKLWLNDSGCFELSASLDDGTNLKPRIMIGEGDSKAGKILEEVEREYEVKKPFMSPDEKRFIENGLNEVVKDIEAKDTSKAVSKAEELKQKLNDPVAQPSGDNNWQRANNIIAFTGYIVDAYGWLIAPSTVYKLNELAARLKEAVSRNDSREVQKITNELEAEAETLLKSNTVLMLLLDLHMKIETYIASEEPILANKFRAELADIESGLKVHDPNVITKPESLQKRVEEVIKKMGPQQIKCPKCGHLNPSGTWYCENCDPTHRFFSCHL